MIGNCPPAPVPTIGRRAVHGIASSAESGVWPNRSRYACDGPFLRRRTPTTLEDDVVFEPSPVDLELPERDEPRIHSVSTLDDDRSAWAEPPEPGQVDDKHPHPGRRGREVVKDFERQRLIQSQVTDFRASSLALSTKPTDFCPQFYRVW